MRILQLTLASSDLDRQAEFWGDRLGLGVERVGAEELEVRLRSSLLRFRRSSGAGEPRYHFAINVPPHSIEAAAAWVDRNHELLAFHGDLEEAEGATIVRTDRDAATLYFLDGGGNVVELISSPHVEGRPAGSFGPRSLLEIAEVGIAVSDTAATVAAVRDLFGAGILWGGEEGSLLTAVGDDHGVIIVAPTGRGWIPVGLPARPAPTEIVAVGEKPAEVTLPEGPYRLRAVGSDGRSTL